MNFFRNYIFFVALYNLYCVYCEFNYPSQNELNTVISSQKCILSIINKYFTEFSTVNIFMNSVEDFIIEKVYKAGYAIKVFNYSLYKFDYFDTEKNYAIILIQNLKNVINVNQIDQLSLWNARAKFIFYIADNSENLLQDFVAINWNYYITNALILMPSSENSQILNIYSWFPYSGGNCGKNVFPKLVDTCNNGLFDKNLNLYPNKVPLTLNGCPINIRVQIWPPLVFPPNGGKILDGIVLNITQGIEVQMMKTIASIVNFTVLYSSSTVPQDWGVATLEGNTSGTIKALREKIADIGMGSFGAILERRMYCDHSYPHMHEALSWCVPKAQQTHRWSNVFKPFRNTTWLSMITTYIFVSAFTWIISLVTPKDGSTYHSGKNAFMFVYCSFLGVPANKTPTKASVRISFIFWLIFGLHFLVAYQAKLIGVILRPSYDYQISTLEEILLSGMDFQLLPTQRQLYSNTDDWRVAQIVHNWNSCFDADACLYRVAYGDNFALSTIKSHAMYEALEYLDAEGQSLVHFIDYLVYTCEMYMTKGFPLRDRISTLIFRIRNSGLIFKWQNDIEQIRLFKYKKTFKMKNYQQVLTLSHLQGAFGILIIGFSLSLLIFLCEIIFDKRKHHKYYISIKFK